MSRTKALEALAAAAALQPPSWEYSPPAATVERILQKTQRQHLAIRATGSTPAEGGPSFELASPTAESFAAAVTAARAHWPDARQFELIGSDLEYKPGPERLAKVPEGATLLKQAEVLALITPRNA